MQQRSIFCRLFAGLFCLAGLVGVLASGCGPSLDWEVRMVKDVDATTPVTALAMLNKQLYVVGEDGKLRTYDVSSPEEPVRGHQTDAFAGPHVGMKLVLGERRLLLMGQDGKLALFRLDDPKKPFPLWGKGKTLSLGQKASQFIINHGVSALYMSPGGGTGLLRLDLSSLNREDSSQIDIKQAIKTFDGGGGGGIVLVFDSYDQSPVRLYTGNRDKGQIDIWLVSEIEGGKPKAVTLKTALGSRITSLFSYKQWLYAVGDPGEDADLQVFDLGRSWKYASAPKATAKATLGGFFRVNTEKQLIVTPSLQIWDFSAKATEPVLKGEAKLSTAPEIRDMIITDQYIYSAEKAGLRIYKFGPPEK